MKLPPLPSVPEFVRGMPARAGRAAMRVLPAVTMRRAVRVLVVSVVAGGVLFLFVLPARTWLSQGRAMSQAQHRISVLAQENRELATKATQLQSPAYIEQIARAEYGLTKPGEQAYGVLLPAATTTVPPPPSQPSRK